MPHKIERNNHIYYLYRHIRLDTDEPFYIGIGIKRIRHSTTHESEYERAFVKKRNEFWKNIVNKTSYIVEILFETDSKELIINKEKEFIKLYGRRDTNEGILVNLTDGGEGVSNIQFSQERRKKITKALLKRVRKQSTFDKIAESKKKAILQFDLKGNFVQEFSSISEAANDTNIKISTISQILKKDERYTAGGYKWKLKSI